MFLELIVKRNVHVLFPDAELLLKDGVIVDADEETVIFVWGLAHFFELELHFEHGFFAFFAVDSVFVKDVLTNTHIFVLQQSCRLHVDKRAAKVFLCQLGGVSVVVVVLFGLVW